MPSHVDRRTFLELAGATFCAAALTTTLTSRSYADEPLVRPAVACSPVIPAGSRILLAYATRCGSTTEIGEAIAGDLRSRNYAVDVLPVADVKNLGGYRAVFLGSAVREGRWLPEAVTFLRQSSETLTKLPTAFFTVHMRNRGSDEKSVKARLAYLDPVRKIVRPNVEAFFAGKLDSSRLGFGARMIIKVMGAQDQDLRDWPVIHSWGKTVFCSQS